MMLECSVCASPTKMPDVLNGEVMCDACYDKHKEEDRHE